MKETENLKNELVIPNEGIPNAVLEMIEKQSKPSQSRSLVFENDKQRNLGILKKGISKPGFVSFEVLRRAANSVPVARICINVLKEKVSKTKWVIKSKDPLAEADEKSIEIITELLQNPNPEDSWRTLVDKMLEDLLILDAVSIEKTRYPDGKLAGLYYVDSATIRPVYNEYGQQDIEIPLPNGNIEPVSYVQIFNNSLYGGPESGDIVAAWPKKDFLYFHMHPQGSLENYGYGLSPLEGILSVVNNLLNADNYNGSYFDETSLPPVILHMKESLEERKLQAFREYMYQELSGFFHRPAIMAGGGEMEVHNLKDMSNTDMQFMEYTKFLATLMTAAYGLSPQDIGLIEDVNRSTSETMKDLSESKGYGSILNLIKEIVNNNIILKDFGFKDIEFDWVAEDSQDPNTSSTIYDRYLRAGILTINEVREKIGEIPYEDWADQPLLLTGDGYVPIHFDEKRETESKSDVQGETVYQDDKVNKSVSKRNLYICRPVLNASEIIDWAKANGVDTTFTEKDMHVTIAFSKQPVDWSLIKTNVNSVTVPLGARDMKFLGSALVLSFESAILEQDWRRVIKEGGTWDYPTFQPHITLSFNALGFDTSAVKPFDGVIQLGPETMSEIQDDWSDSIAEKNIHKSIYTANGYQTWVDDRGFGQPFIYKNILTGKGWVVKPPVAVNVFSQDLEVEITSKLASMGLNVKPVQNISYNTVVDAILMSDPILMLEFEDYINMTPQYDSEKWRSRFGGSRKFPSYTVCEYIEGIALSNKTIVDDMKRDPVAYTQCAIDLANLWKAEKNMVLGDRRADQYIITPEKRAFGFDYQFKGDKKRWEDSSTAIAKVLIQIPALYNIFMENIKSDIRTKKSIKEVLKRILKGALVDPEKGAVDLEQDFESNPVMFGQLVKDDVKEYIKAMFKKNDAALVQSFGFEEISYSFNWNKAKDTLRELVLDNPDSYGGIVMAEDIAGLKYCIYFKKNVELI